MPLVISPVMFRGLESRPSGWRAPTKQSVANKTRTVKVDLSTSTYVTNGWPLTPNVTGLLHVCDVKQLVGYDPYGAKITAQPTLVVEYIDTDVSRPLLKLYVSGVEAGNGTTRSGSIWLEFIGRDS